MKRRIALGGVVSISLILLLFITSCGETSVSDYNAKYVTVMPDVTASMLSPDFWISKIKNPDKEILTPAQIQEMNREGYETLEWFNNLEQWPDTVAADELQKKIDIPFPEGELYIEDTAVTKGYWDKLAANMNLHNIKNTVDVRYGIITARTNIKRYPTTDIITDEQGDVEYDEFQETAAFTGEPLLILHESYDELFLYCVTEYYQGWVSKADIALCHTKAEWQSIFTYTDFLIVTGNMVQLDENSYCPEISNLELYMGTKLPLVAVAEQPEVLYGRRVLGNYVVKVPVRGSDGYVKQEYLPVPISKDVHIGYLPYTHANVLSQLFKMQGDRYGWGGMLDARDCSGLTQELYRCFGIDLPRDGKAQAEYVGRKIDITDKSDAEKEAILTKQVKPGALLQFPGHIMVYLGRHEGKHYVMSAAGSYGVYSESEKEYKSNRTRSVYINTLDTTRASGKTWMESLTTVICLD